MSKFKQWGIACAGLLVVAAAGCERSTQPVSEGAAAEPARPVVELDPAKQDYIWDAEHITFKIENYVGKPFAEALAARDEERLRGFFLEELEASVLASTDGETRGAGILRERKRTVEAAGARPADAAGVVGYLIESVEAFERFESVRLRVLQIDSVDGDPGHWATRLHLNAIGSAADGGPLELVSEHDAEFRFDDKSEFEGGRLLAAFSVDYDVLRTSRRPLMEEVTEEYGLADLPLIDNWELPAGTARQYRYHLAVEDYDLDGYLDIAVASSEGRPFLLRSDGGRRFDDVTESMGLRSTADYPKQKGVNVLAAWVDYDNDGWPDLVLRDGLYHNDAGRGFTDVTEASGLQFGKVPMAVQVADFNGDGLLDLYVAYLRKVKDESVDMRWVGDTESGGENDLWLNEGGSFRRVPEDAGAGGGRRQTFAASAFFYDDDRHPDLYLANDFGINVLLRNRGDGSFDDLTAASGTGDFATSMGVATGDLDNDGSPEIYVANMFSKMGRRIIAHVGEQDYPEGVFEQIEGSCAGNRLYRSSGAGGGYDETSEELGVNGVGWAYAPAMVDVDGDGRLDLYATTGFMSFDHDAPDG